jgi:DNA-binding NarL/FixJ family response regulator
MVVDDHPMWRDGVARDLTEAGYLVTAAVGEGAQALRVAAAAAPEVVVLDLQLPDLSGVDVIRGLLVAVPGVRVLMLSASGEQQDVLDAVKAGANGYLIKSAGPPTVTPCSPPGWPASCWGSTGGSPRSPPSRTVSGPS